MSNTAKKEERPRIQAEYVNRDSSNINREYVLSNPAFLYHMQERERIILKNLAKENIDFTGTKKFLEVGCGSGHVLQRFLEFGVQQAIGIDLIEDRLRKAVAKYPNIQVMLGDGAEIPCNDAEFDLVMQFMCLSSVLDDAIRFQIAKEMWRVLKPGGAVLSYDLRSIPRVTVISLKVLNRFSLLLRGMSILSCC